MTLENQKDKFNLPEDIHYLNCAYMGPLLKSVEEAGAKELVRKRNPTDYSLGDFFDPVSKLKSQFSKLINAGDEDRVSIIPSVSYGLANAAKNVRVIKGGNIIGVEGQFPSNYYIWHRKCQDSEMKMKMVSKPENSSWSETIIAEINSDTAAVVMPQVHWADGCLYDLAAIGESCRNVGAAFIIDGTQSIGAMTFDMQKIKADAVICAGYKWLLGPYGLGLAYYGEYFDNGIPIEENWLPKLKSDEFAGLTEYQKEFRPKAWKYNVGECSNFIYVKMLSTALDEILNWGPENIQSYCRTIIEEPINRLSDLGCSIESQENRGSHLFGISPPDNLNREIFDEILNRNKVFVSKRGSFYRISPHLYNEEKNVSILADCLEEAMK